MRNHNEYCVVCNWPLTAYLFIYFCAIYYQKPDLSNKLVPPHALYDWQEILAHVFSALRKRTDLMSLQMLPVSGSQCDRCLDHDSTNLSTCAVFLKLGSDSSMDSKLKLGWTYFKAGGICFFLIIIIVIFNIPLYSCVALTCTFKSRLFQSTW